MKINQITIGASRTINLGNYESMQVQGSCTIELEDGDLIDLAQDRAIKEVKEQMNEMYKVIKK